MGTDGARAALLQRVVDDVAAHGIGDRSLREIATSVGTSHRMLLYHFGSREGLVAAIVERVEADQRATLRGLAATIAEPAELVRTLWAGLIRSELRPFIRLFFEVVVASGHSATDHSATDLTGPWLAESDDLAALLGAEVDPVEMRLGIAVVRGLLIDVLTTGDVAAATETLERYIAVASPARPATPAAPAPGPGPGRRRPRPAG